MFGNYKANRILICSEIKKIVTSAFSYQWPNRSRSLFISYSINESTLFLKQIQMYARGNSKRMVFDRVDDRTDKPAF